MAYARKYKRKTPFTVKKKKVYRRKPAYGKRWKVGRPRIQYGNNNIGLPATKVVRLCYMTNVAFAPASGVLSTYIYNLASIYDPDYSGAGHQVFGHDQWAALYDNYEVLGAKMTVTFTNNGVNNVPHTVGVIVDKDYTLASTNSDTLKESVHGKGFACLPPASDQSRTVTVYYSPRILYGAKDIVDNHQFKAAMSANPTLPGYAVICLQASDYSSTAASNILAQVRIEYTTRLSSPIELTGS